MDIRDPPWAQANFPPPLGMALVCPPPHMLHLWPWRALKTGGRSAKPDFEAGERAGDKVCVWGGGGRA